jgi:hypothetical protein
MERDSQIIIGPDGTVLAVAGSLPPGLIDAHLEDCDGLWAGVLYQRMVLINYGAHDMSTQVTWSFGADYADIVEVREPRHSARGRDLPAEVTSDHVTSAITAAMTCSATPASPSSRDPRP